MTPYRTAPAPIFGKMHLEISIERLDNGYVVHLQAPPEPLPTPPAESPDDLDAKLDSLMEGIPALGRAIAGGGEGEEWKNREGLAKAKEALKAMFPDLGRAIGVGFPSARPYRQEELVFESKESLLAWLARNL